MPTGKNNPKIQAGLARGRSNAAPERTPTPEVKQGRMSRFPTTPQASSMPLSTPSRAEIEPKGSMQPAIQPQGVPPGQPGGETPKTAGTGPTIRGKSGANPLYGKGKSKRMGY